MKTLSRMIRLSAVGLVVMSISSGSLSQEIAPWKEISANNDCGINCLVVACKLLGKTTDKQEMCTLAKLGIRGTNFENLAHAARQKGLSCRGVMWSLRQLRDWKKPAIAHWENHFVLVRGFQRANRINIIDPPQMPFSMSAEEFREKWDGRLLLLSDKPISIFVGLGRTYVGAAAIVLCVAALSAVLWPRALRTGRLNKIEAAKLVSPSSGLVPMLLLAHGMGLFVTDSLGAPQKMAEKASVGKSYLDVGDNRILNHEIDFGRVIQGAKLECGLVLMNKSERPVEIKGVVTSCACAAAILSERIVPPGKSAQIKIGFNAQGLFGKVSKPSLIRFENSDLKPIKLELKAYVYVPGARFTRSGLYFDKTMAGTGAIRKIEIANRDDPASKWKIVEIHTSSPVITAEYLPNRGVIQVKVSKDAPIGPIREKVIITIKDQGGLSPAEVPVKGEIIGPLKVIPDHLYLGTVEKNGLIRRSFSIVNLTNDEPVIVSPKQTDETTLRLDDVGNDRTVYGVELRAPSNSGFFKGKIRFETNLKEQAFLDVLYAGFVRD